MNNPVIRFIVAKVEIKNRPDFLIVHNISEESWAAFFAVWMAMPSVHDSSSLIGFMKIWFPDFICVTKADFDEITAGRSVAATKEEWESENPNRANHE